MKILQRASLLLLGVISFGGAACAGGTLAGGAQRSAAPEPALSSSPKTLAVAIRIEPTTLAIRALREAGTATYFSSRMFNAELSYLDGESKPYPYLAEVLPQLNSDTWRVFPDGRMETIYRLRPNLTWHDGTPMSAEDFVFGWKVYSWADIGISQALPQRIIEEASAPDDRTLVLRWSEPYANALHMYGKNQEFGALPRHVLEPTFLRGDADAFVNHPYWTREYVGLGPYKLDRWEPGVSVDGVAFDQHVLGRAKIDRVRMRPILDTNTVLANLLAGEVQLTADAAFRMDGVPILKREWVPSGAGTINFHINQWRSAVVQLRPDYADPKGLLDSRVRKALFHAMDRQGINDAVYDGEALLGDFVVAPLNNVGRAAAEAAVKYPYDVRRAEQLMAEAAYARGADGVYTHPTDGRMAMVVATAASSDNDSELAILAAGWRAAGFAAQENPIPAANSNDPELLATFPAMRINSTNGTESTMVEWQTGNIPSAANRWRGSNRGAWNNAEYTDLARSFPTLLDPAARVRQVGPMARIFSDEVPALTLFYRSIVYAHATALTGPLNSAADSSVAWNLPSWEIK